MPRGRPKNDEKNALMRQRLLDATRQLLCQRSVQSLTIRDIASLAGTQSAMIQYHFGGKQGLLTALIADKAAEVRQRVAHHSQHLEAFPGQDVLKPLIHDITEVMSADPWLPRLMGSEVVGGATELGEVLIEHFARPTAAHLKGLLRQLQQAGIIHPSLKPEWAALSLISLFAFPLLAAPVAHQCYDFEPDHLTSPAWRQHLFTLLQQGLFTPPSQEIPTNA